MNKWRAVIILSFAQFVMLPAITYALWRYRAWCFQDNCRTS